MFCVICFVFVQSCYAKLLDELEPLFCAYLLDEHDNLLMNYKIVHLCFG
jgi:hypothetical protein